MATAKLTGTAYVREADTSRHWPEAFDVYDLIRESRLDEGIVYKRIADDEPFDFFDLPLRDTRERMARQQAPRPCARAKRRNRHTRGG